MNEGYWTQFERCALERNTVWSDFERVKYLRKLLKNTLGRLDALKCRPVQNANFIEMEEAMAARTGRELERLESRLLFI